VAVGGLLLAGCGQPRQDENEPAGKFPVDVSASFPSVQHLAQPTVLRIKVHNAGRKRIPDVAVTVRGFDYLSQETGLADAHRPLWVVDAGPRGGDTALVSTWALGVLPAGQTRTFEWRLTPVVAGQHRLKYEVSAGLDRKARAVTRDGTVPRQELSAFVSGQAPFAHVDPNTGAVIKSG
jgi:hypothetical protein